MARHTQLICKKTYNNNSESDPDDTLCKAVNDLISAKTVVSVSISPFGQNLAALVIFDD